MNGQESVGASKANLAEADAVVGLLRRLLAGAVGTGTAPRVAPAEVAVITPYQAQVQLLRERLAVEVKGGVEINTVDAFQVCESSRGYI